MSHAILAIDQGTTSTRAIVFSADGQPLATARRDMPQHYPGPGWVEHDPADIWQSVLDTAREALAAAAVPVAALGITNQRETALLWDRRTGEPVGRAIVWQTAGPPMRAPGCGRMAPRRWCARAPDCCWTRISRPPS